MEISVGFDRKRKGKTQRQEKTQEIPSSNPTRTPGFDEYKVETIWFSFFVLAFQHTMQRHTEISSLCKYFNQ